MAGVRSRGLIRIRERGRRRSSRRLASARVDRGFEKILNRFIAAADVYAVVDKETGKVIGSVGAHIRPRAGDPRKSREIGYALKKSYWNRGLTTEAVRAVIEYLFAETDIEVLWCGHFDYNRASKRVIEKCGFRYYDEETRELPGSGKTIRSLRYIMTREDYLNSRD